MSLLAQSIFRTSHKLLIGITPMVEASLMTVRLLFMLQDHLLNGYKAATLAYMKSTFTNHCKYKLF